jgi:biopolymer transport protein TolR
VREPLKPDMNVTPLVDVVLVLLIIFMVVTPQLESGAAVELPSARNPDQAETAKLDFTTVTLTQHGELYMERDKLAREALVQKLTKLHADEPDERVVLKADRGVRYAEVRSLFKACQDIGFPGVSLQVVEPKKH